jgi:hypothetical protein
MNNNSSIIVKVEGCSDPLLHRIFNILKDRIEQRCPMKVVAVEGEAQLILNITNELPSEVYRISESNEAIQIAGGSGLGLLYGVGKLLRTSRYDRTFQPSSWRGTSAPQGVLRGMYFATHFHNWYHVAPDNEIKRYTEDIALWGANAIMVIFPMINLRGWDDPQAEPAMIMLRQYARIVRELGLQFATSINNTMFSSAPAHIRATPLPDPTHRRGNSGHPICPSNPDGLDYILSNASHLFERLSDIGLNLLVHWPYDEGGCACEKCAPWGSNGYYRLASQLSQLGRQYFPGMKTILSTWMFDTPPEGEWQGLADNLAGDPGWLDYVLADAHEDFPRYPLDHGVPGDLPLLNFPEISMWGNWPWGGFGANPLLTRFQRLWDQVKDAVQGGFPYSEGIYEDLNKAITLQFYWNRDQTAKATVEEYIAYELTPKVTQDVLEMVVLLEKTAGHFYRNEAVDATEVLDAYLLAEDVNNRLPKWVIQNWRWEILYLRAILDRERFIAGSLETSTAEKSLLRLIEIYHSQLETDDPYHHRVRPPLKRAISQFGEY